MKLEPEGKEKLEAMRKRLAAGLPLAGMLAAAAAVGASTQGCLGTPMGRFPAEPPPEEWVLDGDIAPVEQIPPEEEVVTMGIMVAPDIQENPKAPSDGEEVAQP